MVNQSVIDSSVDLEQLDVYKRQVQTYDALSGIIPLDEVQKKIAAGWEKRK